MFAAEFTFEVGFARTEAALRSFGATEPQIAPFRAERSANVADYRAAWQTQMASAELSVFEEDLTGQVRTEAGTATLDLAGEPWSVHLLKVTLP